MTFYKKRTLPLSSILALWVFVEVLSPFAGFATAVPAFATETEKVTQKVSENTLEKKGAKANGLSSLSSLQFENHWGFALGGIDSSELTQEQKGSFLKVKSYWKIELTPQLYFKGDVQANLNSKRSQGHYLYKDNPISLKEAILEYTPFHWLKVRGGALNQGRFQSPLLIDSVAFPGLMAEAHLLKERVHGYQLDFFASQSIPTSQSKNSERQEKEKTPSFLTSGFVFSLPSSRPEKFRLQYFQFYFSHLPNKVAYESGLRGNTVHQVASGQSARFTHTFAGYSLQSQLGYQIHPQWTLYGSYQHLRNNRTTKRLGQGELLSGSVYWNALEGPKSQWEGTYGIFYNGSDSSPSAYNSGYFGHNNRKGSFWKLSHHKKSYSLHTQYWSYGTLYSNPHQGDKQLFMLELEVHRVSI